MPQFYNIRPVPRPVDSSKRRLFTVPLFLAIVLLLAAYAVYCLLRPVGDLKTIIIPPVIPGQVKVNIPWPTGIQAAYGAQGYGLLASNSEQKPLPTASVAKTITALAVLSKKPLKADEAGPSITMTANDQALYGQYISQDGSAVPVYAGETISERQMLEGMMLPSANNLADTAAIWAFGSMQNYSTFANQFVRTIGMTQTTIGSDASGFSPSTTSTASDLVRLGIAALGNAALAQIVAERQADFPNYGTIDNVNSLVGSDGVRGIKTGNTDQAGGVYLGAADVAVGDKTVTVVTAVIGAPTLGEAMRDSVPMIRASASEFQNTQVVRAEEKVGRVTAPWGATSTITASNDISVLTWSGTALSPHVTSRTVSSPIAAGTNVGTLSFSSNGASYESQLTTTSAISGPTVFWRLTHPL